jgi:glycosyltransferase involved in cell wall biosynthesis
MATLSVVTLTMNEENNIVECLASVRWADQMIVVDSGSTDRTVELAKGFTANVFVRPWEGYGAARNFAITKATGDWIFWLDADERVTPELAGEIREVLRSGGGSSAGFSVARRAYFLGRWIRHSGWYPSRVTRMFRRGEGRFNESRVHEQLMIEGPVSEFRNDLIHYTDPSLEHYLAKFNSYTTLAAEDLDAQGRKFSVFDLLVRPPFLLVKMYVLRLGFLDGVQGLILALLSSAYVFTKYAKLWERKQQNS